MKKTEEWIRQLAELKDEEIRQVTGGLGETGKLDEIMKELSSWLDAHPNATKLDIYDRLIKLTEEYADELNENERYYLNQLAQTLLA